MLFGFKGLDHEELKRLLATGASDDEVLDWVNSRNSATTSLDVLLSKCAILCAKVGRVTLLLNLRARAMCPQ